MLVAVALALLVAGCGKADRTQYERDLAKVGRGVDASLESLPQDDTETIGAEEVSKIADDLREAADQLADLDPPDDVRDAQDRLESGLRGVADAFSQLAKDLGDADTSAAQAELYVKFANDDQVDAAFEDLVAAQEAFADKGYRVFGTAPTQPAASK
ncbi:MAG: hypothetical protein KDC46_14690 [Thermoleophilia bacterium]|nr:hypothetical protein [Thermoleophilia bacterium]